jgi:type IV secretion system protein TrbL
MGAFGAGVANVMRSGARAAGQRFAAGASAVRDRVMAAADPGASAASEEAAGGTSSSEAPARAPAWARRLQRKQRLSQGASTAAHTVRSADHGGSGASPNLHDSSNE